MAMTKQHFSKRSAFSGKTNIMELTLDVEDYKRWQNGEVIQKAMPYLTDYEREFLMTGVTADEWLEMFGRGCKIMGAFSDV